MQCSSTFSKSHECSRLGVIKQGGNRKALSWIELRLMMFYTVPFRLPHHPFLQAQVIIKMTLESPNWIFWFIIAQILLHWPQRFQFMDVLRGDQRVPQVEDRRMLLVVTHEMTPCLMTAWFKKPLTLPQVWASSLAFIHLPISAIMSHTLYGHQFARWSL